MRRLSWWGWRFELVRGVEGEDWSGGMGKKHHRQLRGGGVQSVEEGIHAISLVLASIRKWHPLPLQPVIFLMPD